MKTPPYSKDHEMMVLGCMLTSFDNRLIAADALDDSDFYFTEHKIVFNSIKSLHNSEKTIDYLIVCEELKRLGKLESVGGYKYVGDLNQFAGTSANIDAYSQLVKDKSILRKVISASQDMGQKALEEPADVASFLDESQQILFDIGRQTNSKCGVHVADILNGTKPYAGKHVLQEIQENQERFKLLGPDQPIVQGVPSGFTDLDKMIFGFSNSNLIILAARPSVGKTALAMNIAENVCFDQGNAVGIFTLEMDSREILHRMLCSRSGVCSEKIKTGSLNGLEYQKIVEVYNHMINCPLILEDQPNIPINDLRARARRMKEIYGIKLLVIDYLQLITGGRKSFENRQNEIAEISRKLKGLAKELHIPVLCLAQLSREVEKRENNRPRMSDLRESGSLEQDADVVMLLFRQGYQDESGPTGHPQLIVAKNRHGKVGTVKLEFQKELAKFRNLAPFSAPQPSHRFPGDDP